MRAKAKKLCAMLLVLLCLTSHFQEAACRDDAKGGAKGGPKSGAKGGSKKPRHHHHHHYDDYDHDDDDQPYNHTNSAAAEPRGRGLNWRVSGAAATIAAAGLVW
ncbi:unnamed protein product [Alopecurus aequalis]